MNCYLDESWKTAVQISGSPSGWVSGLLTRNREAPSTRRCVSKSSQRPWLSPSRCAPKLSSRGRDLLRIVGHCSEALGSKHHKALPSSNPHVPCSACQDLYVVLNGTLTTRERRMDVYEAARLLDDMVRQGEPIGRKATAVHLFGIMYADELKRLKPRCQGRSNLRPRGVDVQRLCQGNGPAIMSVVAVSSQ